MPAAIQEPAARSVESAANTYTFLFSDLEGSTRLWREHGVAMRAALERHDDIFQSAATRLGGHLFRSMGDAFYIAFIDAASATQAALEIQRDLMAAPGAAPGTDVKRAVAELRVRIALHTGIAESRGGDYFGLCLARVARLRDALSGGQVVLSAATALQIEGLLPADTTLLNLGPHRLRDFPEPEPVFQVCHPDLAREFPALRTSVSVPSNIPRGMTSFIGRERETDDIVQRLRRSPLITLTGAGGCGKTRLALHVAATVVDDYADGLFLVDLSPLPAGAEIERSIAAALRLKDESSVNDTQESLCRHLQNRQMLLIVDNCEHVIDSAAAVVQELLERCPRLSILATSREALSIPGETAWAVPTLSVPDSATRRKIRRLVQFEAPRLYIERAEAVAPQSPMRDADASAIAQICQRLDGIPLAIEIVASWATTLTPKQTYDRLNDRFRLLRAPGARTALPRQKTLYGAIDWSHALLTEGERRLLRQLSVFRGGWTIESAEAVCSTDSSEADDVLENLHQLVRKSLVASELTKTGMARRYRMLETIREYAAEALATTGESVALEARYRQHFCEYAEAAAPHLAGTEQKLWMERLEADNENLWNALTLPGDPDASAEPQARLISALYRFWRVRGYASEALQRVAPVHAAIAPKLSDDLNANCVHVLGGIAMTCGALAEARQYYLQSAELREKMHDAGGAAAARANLASVDAQRGDYAGADSNYGASLKAARELGDPVRIASILINFGRFLHLQKKYSKALTYLEESLLLWRQQNDQMMLASCLQNLAAVSFELCRYHEARRYVIETLGIQREIEERSYLAISITTLAHIEFAEGRFAKALLHYSAADKIRVKFRSSMVYQDRQEFEAKVDHLRGLFGTGFSAIWAAGEQLEEEQILNDVLQVDS